MVFFFVIRTACIHTCLWIQFIKVNTISKIQTTNLPIVPIKANTHMTIIRPEAGPVSGIANVKRRLTYASTAYQRNDGI